MNQELPKPARNALARQGGGEVHPSPDVLTSFMERTLPHDERDLVTSHLALCADCREVVFLASGAAEDALVDEEELVAAAAAPQLVPTPVYGNARQQPAALAEIPRRRWALRLSWAAAAMVALLVSGVVIWQRFNSGNLAVRSASSVASNSPRPDAAALSGAPSAPETLEKTTRAKTASPGIPGAVAADTLALKKVGKYQSEPTVAARVADESAQAPASVAGGTVAAPAPGPPTASEENQANAMQLHQSAALAKPMMSMRAVDAARGQWRISVDGHLERRVATDDWTRVLTDQATTFHVVSVVGSDVWAGGSGGALLHSSDGGQHWRQVPLVTGSGAETGTIVSIQFNDSQQGTVITAGGSRWSTSDGGITWTSR